MKNLINKILKSKIFVSSTMVSAATAIGGIVQYFFHIIIQKLLPLQYGDGYTLISLSTIIGIPSLALQFVMSHDISMLIHLKDWITLKAYMKKMYFIIT